MLTIKNIERLRSAVNSKFGFVTESDGGEVEGGFLLGPDQGRSFFERNVLTDVSIPWFTERLHLLDQREIANVTAQYDTDDGRAAGWSPEWTVIGQDGGDPVFIDREDGSVRMARHGVGRWEPVLLAHSFDDFLLTLAVWTEALARHGNSPLDDDFMPDDTFFGDVRNTLAREGLPVEPMEHAWATFMATV